MSKLSSEMSAPKLGMKRGKPPSFSEFTLAQQTLDDSTMITACSLLLSERDYQDGSDGESDYSKLLSIYRKCRDAASIVEQHVSALPQNVPNLPIPPASMALTPSARAAAARAGKKSQGQLNSMSPPKRMSLAQIARSTGVSRSNNVIQGPRRPALKRVPSDSSIASVNSTGSRGGSSNKKARMGHDLGAANSNNASAVKKAAVPPAAARNFLQALNNQKQRNQKSKERDNEVSDTGKNNTQSKRVSPRNKTA